MDTPEPVVTRAGDVVTYHGPDGDQDATVVRFDGLSRAELELADGTVVKQVPRVRILRCWEPKGAEQNQQKERST